MGELFTKENAAENGRKGAAARLARTTPEERHRLAQRAAHRRWYKYSDSDMDRVDRHLRILSGIVGMALSIEDYVMVIRAISAMAPFERMKIAMNSGMVNVTPGSLIEGQAQIESKLVQSMERRRRAFVQNTESEPIETTSSKLPSE